MGKILLLGEKYFSWGKFAEGKRLIIGVTFLVKKKNPESSSRLNCILLTLGRMLLKSSQKKQGPKNSRKGTHPSGRVSSKRYSSCFHFHSSIQTERVAKLRFLPFELGRLLELMPVSLSCKSYNFR